MNKHKRGFTLIELLVVVLIIGILASVALPQYQKSVFKSQATVLKVQVDEFVKAQRIHFLENGSFTDDLTNLYIDTKTDQYPWFCGKSGDLIYCNTKDVNGKLHWNVVLPANGSIEIQCWAKTSDATAMGVCKVETENKGTKHGDWTHFSISAQ